MKNNLNKLKNSKKKYTKKKKKLINLSQTSNPYRNDTQIEIKKIDFSTYPNKKYSKLKKIISKKYFIKKENIALFNGASKAIKSIIKDKDITIYSPSYPEYEKYAKSVKYINRFENIYKKPEFKSTIVFVNPSFPDGRYYNLEKLFQIWKEQKCKVIIDETFLDFTPNSSDFEPDDNLYIIKSLTKFYSSSGLRVGVVFSSKKNIKSLQSSMEPYQISKFDAYYISKSLKNRKFEKKSISYIVKLKNDLLKVLKSSKYIKKIYTTNTHFFMIKLKKDKKNKFYKKCQKKSILVYSLKDDKFLNDNYILLSIQKDIIKTVKYIL